MSYPKNMITCNWDRWAVNKNKFVLFSGGKDSLACLSLCKEAYGDVEAVHVSVMGLNLDYIREVCGTLGAKLTLLNPDPGYFELVEKWGFPRLRARWCCYYLKIKPILEYVKKFPNKVIFDGMRREENPRRRTIPGHYWDKRFKCFVARPVVDWTGDDITRYVADKGLPINPAYRDFRFSAECFCGVFSPIKTFERLRVVNPDLFNKLVELESKMKGGGSALYRGGKGRIYLKDMKKQKLLR